MGDGLQRWSQVVRRPSTVILQGHHAVNVPAMAGEPEGSTGRPGVRLLVSPFSGDKSLFAIDVTSSAVMAMLEGWLHSGVGIGRRLGWQSRGAGVHRRDTIFINGGV